MKKGLLFGAVCVLIIASLLSGCVQYQRPAEEPAAKTTEKAATPAGTEKQVMSSKPKQENKTAAVSSDEAGTTTETTTDSAGISVEPVPEKKEYAPSEPEPSKTERDTCGCSFRWDPICSNDGKTYVNDCLFKCFGYKAEDIKSSNQCPKDKASTVYTDDIEFDYESKKSYGGYCWRKMWRTDDFRECENLIVNGRVDDEPAPAKGNWLNQEHLEEDMFGTKDSYTIHLKTGYVATNEEYNASFQPLFENGRYVFSFWARQDVAANNDWKVKLTLKDWWDQKPMPTGVKGCYEVSKEINANEVYIETEPNEWRHYHFEFDVPLKLEQWTGYKRVSSECEYSWDMVPHGYGIQVTGPTVGEAWFDDFSLVK